MRSISSSRVISFKHCLHRRCARLPICNMQRVVHGNQFVEPSVVSVTCIQNASGVLETSGDAIESHAISQGTSRRSVLAMIGMVTALVKATPAEAYLIDEEVTDRVNRASEASVVSVANKRRFRGQITEDSTATGVVWDARGYIVTNYHCIQPTLNDQTGQMFVAVQVGMSGGPQSEYEAEIFRSDADHDLAVLRIDAPDGLLTPIKMGRSSELKVGQSVYAIGNSYGLSKTFTAGVVSGLNRGVPTPSGAIATGAIQTDASINQGNSGGPLLDSSGRVVGLSTATFSSNKSQGRGSGVNFAIASDTMRDIIPKLIVYGSAYGKG